MKYYFALLLVIINIDLQAQDYTFGKVSKHELERKVSDIDADANAEYLYRKESVYYAFNQKEGFVQKKEVHYRIKIYNKEGLDWGNHSVRLFNKSGSARTKISAKNGYTYNLIDGKVEKTKLKSESVFEEELNEYWKKVSFAFPNVKEGTVIELKYELEEPFVGSIDDIYVQALIPIKTLSVVVKIPEYFNFKKTINPKAAFYPKLVETIKNRQETLISKTRSGFYTTRVSYDSSNLSFKENITTINLENIPPLKEENYVDNLQNYVAKIVWEYSFFKGPDGIIQDYASNWGKVSNSIYDSQKFGGQLKKTGYFEDELDKILAGINDPMQKVTTVFQFVKSKVKWNEYYGKYVIKGVRKAFQDGSGNVAEINLMLTAMLRHAGFDANPVLVSTKNHGIPLIATLDGFNYVISAVELQNDMVLLDATDSYALPNVLPKRTINWRGRLIRKNGSSTWASLEQKSAVLDSKIMNYEITPDLKVKGKIRELKTLQLAQNARKKDSKLSEEEIIEKLVDKDFEITIENFELKNEDDFAKPYLKSFDFSSNELVEEIGDKLYISPLLFYSVNESPFKEESRKYPIDFTYPFSNKYLVNILMPQGYELEHLPQSAASKLSEDTISTYKYIVGQNGQYIQLHINFDFNYALVPVTDYVAFREYFNAYLEKISEKIVFKKSSNPITP